MVQSPWRNRRPGRRQQKASTPVHDCHVYAVVGSRTWICDSGSVHGVGFSTRLELSGLQIYIADRGKSVSLHPGERKAYVIQVRGRVNWRISSAVSADS